VGRLREFLARPLTGQPRRVLAGLALSTVLGGAILATTLTGRRATHERTASLPSPPKPGHRRPAASNRQPRSRRPSSPRHGRSAAGFLAGYLPFLYGRGSARQLTDASARLRVSLARQRTRITPAQRRRHPRVISVVAIGQSPGSAIVTARIDDGGVAPYPLTFTLRGRQARWTVTGLGND